MNKLEPRIDNFHRTTKSTKLWVVKIKNLNGKTLYHVVDGIERSVCTVRGREGEFIRYEHWIFPLHSQKGFKRIIRKVKNGKAFMWHFMGPGHENPESLDTIKRLPFIIEGQQIAGY
ncbi:hypothetical protein [Vreelandella profundi]|uniref:hypothetical protein n=1 Tax=Vreelandella profundi TaxID=2852117 RepID=UPI001F2238DA|nr:hypothetical protein [Halomonas profundi]